MIIPQFRTEQDDETVSFAIRVPHFRANSIEFEVQGDSRDVFVFHSGPYFLRLSLSNSIVGEDDPRIEVKYDVDNSTVCVRIPKEVPGENFEGLELLTQLLRPKPSPTSSSIIEEVKEGESGTTVQLVTWGNGYGFGGQYKGMFINYQGDLLEVIDNPDPDEICGVDVKGAREYSEWLSFDPEHYMADYLHPSVELERSMSFNEVGNFFNSEITDEERSQMKQLPFMKEYSFNENENRRLLVSLIGILFGFSYNFRMNCGEDTCESHWTIAKLSGTLSWMEWFDDIHECLLCSYRRALTFPLFRNFDLCQLCHKDVSQLLSFGKITVLRTLLRIRRAMSESEERSVLNKLFIDDYASWIQQPSVSNDTILEIAREVSCCEVTKEEFTNSAQEHGYPLLELEELTKIC